MTTLTNETNTISYFPMTTKFNTSNYLNLIEESNIQFLSFIWKRNLWKTLSSFDTFPHHNNAFPLFFSFLF